VYGLAATDTIAEVIGRVTLATLGSDFALGVNLRRLRLLLLAAAALSVLPGVVLKSSFELGSQLTVPSVFGAVLFLGAAALSPAVWSSGSARAATLFALIAVYEGLELHDGAGVDGALAAGVVVALASAWLLLGALPGAVSGARVPFVAAALIWALGGVLSDALTAESGAALKAGELLELTGAVLLVVALVAGLKAAGAREDSGGGPARLRDLAAPAALAADVRVLVMAVISVMAVFGVLGAIDIAGADWRILDLNEEQTLPAYFSSLLLWAAAGLALLLSRLDPGSARLWLGWALVLVILAFDEAGEAHERLQYHFDVSTLVALSPVIVLAGVMGLAVLRRIWGDIAACSLMLAGAAAWVLALVLDRAHHPNGTNLDYLIVAEEMLEMGGSTLIALSLLGLARRAAATGSSAAQAQ
jgi:hypothetical protein